MPIQTAEPQINHERRLLYLEVQFHRARKDFEKPSIAPERKVEMPSKLKSKLRSQERYRKKEIPRPICFNSSTT